MANLVASPDSGAGGTDYQTVQALIRAGHDVQAVWSDELNIKIKHHNLSYLLELPRVFRDTMLSRMRTREFDIVQISQPHGYLAAQTVARNNLRTVFVHRSHGFEPRARADLHRWRVRYGAPLPWPRQLASHVMSRLLERNNRLITKYADGHLVSASECAEYMAAVYKVRREHIAIIPQAVSHLFLRQVHPTNADRTKKMLYVGQYVFVKAPMILGEVVSRLLRRCPEAEFTWVCSARDHVAAATHLSNDVVGRVRFLDWMRQDELVDVYDSHGLFLFPSFVEGFGKVFLEAMSRGLIVIACKNGGAKDVINDGVDGFTVKTGDVDAMVQAAAQMFNNTGAAKEISRNAIAKAQACTWDRYAQECSRFYAGLLDKKRLRIMTPSSVHNNHW